jgi:hypothetical protein
LNPEIPSSLRNNAEPVFAPAFGVGAVYRWALFGCQTLKRLKLQKFLAACGQPETISPYGVGPRDHHNM